MPRLSVKAACAASRRCCAAQTEASARQVGPAHVSRDAASVRTGLFGVVLSRGMRLLPDLPADFRERVPDRGQQVALLSRGVLAFDGRRLEFASRLAATFAAEVLHSRLPRSVAEQLKLPR